MDKHKEKSAAFSEVNTHEQYQRSIQFVIESVSKRYKILMFICIASIFITIINHFFYLPTYEARSTVRVQSDQKVSAPILLAQQQGMGYMSDSREMGRYTRFLQSENFLVKVAQTVKLSPDYAQLDLTNPKSIVYFSKSYWDHYLSLQNSNEANPPVLNQDVKEIAGKISQLVKIEIDGGELITLTVSSFNSQTSTLIANAVVEEFARSNLQNDAQEIVEVEKFIKEKLETVKENLKNGETNMIALKERNHMYSTENVGNEVSEQLKDINRKQSELWIQEAENNSKLKLIQQNADNLLQSHDKEVRDFKVAELIKKNEEISRQRANLKNLADKSETKYAKLPKAEQEYFALKRQEQVDFELYSSLVQKLSQLEIQKYSIQKKVIVESLAKAANPVARVNFILKLMFSFLASLFFGVVIALTLDWVDPTIKNSDDLLASRFESIGVIPRIKHGKILGSKGKKSKKMPELEDLSRMLITKDNPKSIESMSFKYIRARLQKILDKNGSGSKIILVTSATSGDGKTFASCNLAISFAQLGKRTLLIDADFRHPSVNRYFEIPNRKGLAAVLKMENALDDVVVQDDTISTLHLLPADWGVEDPTELISDEKMLVLLEHLKQEYEYIIIDSPPIQMVVDGLILSSLASTVLVVGRYRQTLKRLLGKTYSDLVNVNYQKIYGILNDAEQSKLLKYFGNYGLNYGSIHDYGHGKNKSKYYLSEQDLKEDEVNPSERKKAS